MKPQNIKQAVDLNSRVRVIDATLNALGPRSPTTTAIVVRKGGERVDVWLNDDKNLIKLLENTARDYLGNERAKIIQEIEAL